MIDDNFLNKLTDINTEYVKSVIRLADEYELDRNDTIWRSVGTLMVTVKVSDFSEFKIKEESDCKSM